MSCVAAGRMGWALLAREQTSGCGTLPCKKVSSSFQLSTSKLTDNLQNGTVHSLSVCSLYCDQATLALLVRILLSFHSATILCMAGDCDTVDFPDPVHSPIMLAAAGAPVFASEILVPAPAPGPGPDLAPIPAPIVAPAPEYPPPVPVVTFTQPVQPPPSPSNPPPPGGLPLHAA